MTFGPSLSFCLASQGYLKPVSHTQHNTTTIKLITKNKSNTTDDIRSEYATFFNTGFFFFFLEI